MLAKSYILQNLNALNSKYNKSKRLKDSLFYSKLAVLELCGWIEESMDDLVIRCAKKHLKNQSNFDYIKKEVVKRTYGFDYERDFRLMLMKLLGLINFERLENKVDPTKLSKLRSTLAVLKTTRNSEAHTHIKGVTRSINSPSVTMQQFHDVYHGLAEFDKEIKGLKI